MKQMTSSDDPTDREMLDAFNLAENMIRECFEESSYSNLETAIFLLRQARDQLQETDPLRSNALHHLSLALHVRFNKYGWMEDLGEICKNIMQGMSEPHVRPLYTPMLAPFD